MTQNSFNLTKATEQVAFNLTKRGITLTDKDINVSLILDYSASMSQHYTPGGRVEDILKRLLSISNTIDDDGLMELVLFTSNAYQYGQLSVDQYDEARAIVQDICARYSMGNTQFSPAISKILEILTVNSETPVPVKKEPSFFSKLFGAKEEVVLQNVPVIPGKQLLILISDGENSSYDNRELLSQIDRIEQLPNVYLQFVAIGFDSKYMQDIADRSDSVGYSSIASFNYSDDQLIESILSKELMDKFSKVVV